jgi:hypothetical protein
VLISASTWGLDKPGRFTGQVIYAGGVRWQLGNVTGATETYYSSSEDYRAEPLDGARTALDSNGVRRKLAGRTFEAYWCEGDLIWIVTRADENAIFGEPFAIESESNMRSI